ncbi:MAG TPA: hypothetical protein VM261_33690, partial [Kofleriaceae bacterium]|nr:hypothetical protein [Kofleriaceae bacterium]
MKIFTTLIISVVAVATLATVAVAEPLVLQLDKGLVYVDLGSRDGVGAGTELELVREVVATDPVSKTVLRDKFALGTLTVVKAGEKVCQARPSEDLAGRVKVGDEIRLASERRSFVDPWAMRVADSKRTPDAPAPIITGPGADRAAAARAVEEALAARTVWEKTLGKAPVDRAHAWRAFLTARPGTPYAGAIRAEIASLDAQQETLDRAAEAAAAPEPVLDRRRALAEALAVLRNDPSRGPFWVGAPSRVAHGQPIVMTFAVREQVEGAMWLYVRGGAEAGDQAFRRVELKPDGDAYLRATIPAELVKGDRVDWFVEVGEGMAGMGSRDEPRSIAVDRDVVEPPPAPNRTTIAMSVDYVDFDGSLQGGYDQYYQAEADFTYRFLQPVHAVRIGFGTLSGKGGPKDIIDAAPEQQPCRDVDGRFHCRSVDYTYVYTEVELQPKPHIALMLRPIAGLLTTDRDAAMGSPGRCRDAEDLGNCEFETGFGFRGRVRFGEERGTNLEVGLGFTSQVGTLFEAAYHWTPAPVVPVKLAVQVTDLPVTTDFGVRLVSDVGWRGMSWVYPSVRLSYQARDIDHAGFS